MVKNVTQLAERNKRLHKRGQLEQIHMLMLEYGISNGEVIEYRTNHKNDYVSTGDRLSEIRRARKKGNQLLAQQKANMAKARQTRKDKREKLVSSVTTPEEVISKLEL